MASVTAKEIPEVQQFFTELWSMYKKYYTPEEDDAYWNYVVNDFSALRKKFENVKVSKQMIFAVLDDLEERHKERRRKK